MTDKEILVLKRKINKARIEVSTVFEELQDSVDRMEPKKEDEKPADDEPPF